MIDKLPLADFDSPNLSIDDVDLAADALLAWAKFTKPKEPRK